jgi:hypothetical protein
MARMYEWYDRVGTGIDIASLHQEYPKVNWRTFKVGLNLKTGITYRMNDELPFQQQANANSLLRCPRCIHLLINLRMIHSLSEQCYKYYLSGLYIVILIMLEYLVRFQHQRSMTIQPRCHNIYHALIDLCHRFILAANKPSLFNF